MSCAGLREEHVVHSEIHANMGKLLTCSRELTIGLHQGEILVHLSDQLWSGRHVNEATMGVEELELCSIDLDRRLKADIIRVLQQLAALTGRILFENRLDKLIDVDHGSFGGIEIIQLVRKHQFGQIGLETTSEGG